MKNLLHLSLGCLLALFFYACGSSKVPEDAVARVDDEYLCRSDLQDVVRPGTLANDSIEAIQAYIQNWIQQQLMARKANANLSDDQKRFDKEIEHYKNSLIIHAYQSALLAQALDTVVSEADIENYYREQSHLFLLKNNILRLRFVKLDQNVSKTDQESIFELMFNTKEMDGKQLQTLSELVGKYNLPNLLDHEKWLSFDDLLKEIPIEVSQQEDFLRQNTMFQVPDGDNTYYVRIDQYKLKNTPAPIDNERSKIINLILNKRKVKLIENLIEEVMKEGEKNRQFEIY